LEFLDENNADFEIIDIVNDPLSELEIKTLLKKMGKTARSIIRTNETLYKNQFEGKEFSDEEWIRILAENPSLIQRPILIKGKIAMIARPVEKAKFFIEK